LRTTRTLAGGPTRPFWVTVTERPAMVSVAVREFLDVFPAIESVAVPGPETLLPGTIHDGAPDVDHAHPVCVVTVTALVLAVAPTVSVAGETE
jgi:hypothetical protein